MATNFMMLSRDLFETEDYLLERFTRREALLDLLYLAAYKDRSFKIRGNVVEQKAGQVAKSIRELAGRWHWSVNTVQRYLKELESDGVIDTQKSNVIQVISIKKYLILNTQSDTQFDTQTDTPINKEYIYNNNKEKDTEVSKRKPKEKKKKDSVPPTLDEVAAYIKEKGFHFNAKEFIDYYEADDWHYGKKRQKVTSWKRCCLTWEKNRKNDYPSLFGQETDVTNDQGETMVIPPEWNIVGEDGRHYETYYDMTRQQNSYEEYFEQYGNYK